MLPPPTTTATCTPLRTTSPICRAIVATVVGSMPSGSPPANASPESLSSTRLQRGLSVGGTSVGGTTVTGQLLARGPPQSSTRKGAVPMNGTAPPRSFSGAADLEAGEALERHAGAFEDLLNVLLAGVGLDGRLLEQHDVLVEAVHPTLDDLGQGLLGLALLAGGRLGDAALVLHEVRRHVVAGQVLRAHGADLHRGTAGGALVGAVELDQDADLRRQVAGPPVHVGRDLAV